MDKLDGLGNQQVEEGPGSSGQGQGWGWDELQLALCSSRKLSPWGNVPEHPGVLCPSSFSTLAVSEP